MRLRKMYAKVFVVCLIFYLFIITFKNSIDWGLALKFSKEVLSNNLFVNLIK